MSTIKIYNSEILPSKNMLVDDLSDYLSSLTATYESECQYLKIQLETTLKIVINQSKVTDSIGNYLVLNQDDKDYYFFITKADWTSKEAVTLSLYLDTINTFSSELDFNEKTTISRQHKDRYKTLNKWELTATTVDSSTYKTTIKYNVDFSQYFKAPSFKYFPLLFNNSDVTIYNKYHQPISYLLNVTNIEWEDYSNDNYNIVFYRNNQIVGKIEADSYEEWFKEHYLVIQADVNIDDASTRIAYNNYLKCINGYWVAFSYKYKVIDLLSEGITPVKYHSQATDVTIKEEVNDDYYLIYKNDTSVNETTKEIEVNDVVSCYLTTRKNHLVGSASANSDLYSGSFSIYDNELYTPVETVGAFLTSSDNPNAILYYQTHQGKNIQLVDFTDGNNYILMCFTHLKNSRYDTTRNACYLYKYDSDWNYLSKTSYEDVNKKLNKFYFTNVNTVRYGNYKESSNLVTSISVIENYPVDENYSSASGGRFLNPISSLNRTDETLIKVIKLPYAPFSVKLVDNVIKYDTNIWNYSSSTGYLKLINLNSKFENSFEFNTNPLNSLVANISPKLTQLRNDMYETKLLHSDYYTPKFVYDSFNLGLALEQIDLSKFNAGKLEIKFNPTSTINSRFLFTFPQYVLNHSTTDYDNIIYVNRNNEETLYNSAYINYIKTGFNYDKKKIEAETTAKWVSTGIQLAAGAASLAASSVTGGLSAVAGISLIASSLSSIASNINTTVSAERDLEQKLNQYKNQAVTVAGADDVDLLDVYSNNKMKICYYEVSDNLKEQLGDLFYYTGYIENVQAIPDLDTRSWFNYIMCDAVFNNNNVYEDYIKDIKARYKTGVTVFHDNLIDNVKTWDFEQKYENWENSLLN